MTCTGKGVGISTEINSAGITSGKAQLGLTTIGSLSVTNTVKTLSVGDLSATKLITSYITADEGNEFTLAGESDISINAGNNINLTAIGTPHNNIKLENTGIIKLNADEGTEVVNKITSPFFLAKGCFNTNNNFEFDYLAITIHE